MKVQNAGSNAEALAIKDAALRATLEYIEYKNGPGEWFKDELAYRVHRMVEKALAVPGEQENTQDTGFLALSRRPRNHD